MPDASPYLQFDFRGECRCYADPAVIIKTRDPSRVLACLEQVHAAVDRGMHAAGYIAYEAVIAFVSGLAPWPRLDMPLLWFGLFQGPCQPRPSGSAPRDSLSWSLESEPETIKARIAELGQRLQQGELDQVNFTTRLHAPCDPAQGLAYYQRLKAAQDSDYCAYLNIGEHQVLSASPELFFHWLRHRLTTRPMKGTMARGDTEAEDQRNRQTLYHSAKDRAENAMIVELMRRDLENIARPEDIAVAKWFAIEEYPTVWQMTSTLTAKLRPDLRLAEVMAGLFPCASIAGTPRDKALQTIRQIEASPREAYCGAVGFMTPDGPTTFNVAIRTVRVNNADGTASYGVGGGITRGSTPEGEYQEMLTKSRILE